MNKSYLQKIREVQGQTGPNMCLASNKFLALKLLGFVDPTKKLNDFLNSPWARQHHGLPLSSYWGGSMAAYNDAFNKTALPAAVNDPSAGVKAPGTGQVRFATGFTWFHGTAMADSMLNQRTPLIVASAFMAAMSGITSSGQAGVRPGSGWGQVRVSPGSGRDSGEVVLSGWN